MRKHLAFMRKLYQLWVYRKHKEQDNRMALDRLRGWQ